MRYDPIKASGTHQALWGTCSLAIYVAFDKNKMTKNSDAMPLQGK